MKAPKIAVSQPHQFTGVKGVKILLAVHLFLFFYTFLATHAAPPGTSLAEPGVFWIVSFPWCAPIVLNIFSILRPHRCGGHLKILIGALTVCALTLLYAKILLDNHSSTGDERMGTLLVFSLPLIYSVIFTMGIFHLFFLRQKTSEQIILLSGQ